MKLTIDTKEDSHDEIRKAIRMLATIVGDEHVYTNSSQKQHNANIFESSSSSITQASSEPSGSIFGNIFGDSSPVSAPEEKKEEEKKEKPHIIIEY